MPTGTSPTDIKNPAPCFYCGAHRNTLRDKCWDACDRLYRWNKERILRAARETTSEKWLREMEQTVDQQSKEFISALEESSVTLEREEHTDEEIGEMADEILADLEKENEG